MLFLFLAAVFVKDVDVAACTINAIDDPRTHNKALYLRPQGNVYSINELVAMWENKIGKELEKIHVLEEELLLKIKGMYNVPLSKEPSYLLFELLVVWF